MKHFVKAGRQMCAKVTRLARILPNIVLRHCRRQNQQRDAYTGQQCPEPIHRYGNTDQDQKPHKVAACTGYDGTPHIPHGIHIRLHPLDQKAGWVTLVKAAILQHQPV